MKPNLPYWLFLGAMGSIALSNACKENFPDTLGRMFVLHWGSAIFSAFLFSLGLFLSLYGLFSQREKRRRYVLPCLLNLSFFLALPIIYFASYVFFIKIYYLPDELPSMLPKLVENAQNADTETKRLKIAKAAYEMYGVKIVYRGESGDLVRYEPSGQDEAFRLKQKQSEGEIQAARKKLKDAIDQFPYLFGFYMGAFFLTFSVGACWVAFRRLKPESNLQS